MKKLKAYSFLVPHNSMFASVILDNFQTEERVFLHPENEITSTSFVISVNASLEGVTFPDFGHDFLVKKKEYNEKYGTYSPKSFEVIMRRLVANFKLLKELEFALGIKRRIWIFKQMYELFDASTGLLVVSYPHVLATAVSKAIEILLEPAIQTVLNVEESEKINMISRSLEVIKTVCMKFANIMFNDDNLLKLLPTKTLIGLVEYLPNQMVSKFRRLPWIDPILVDRVVPKFNGHWQKIWSGFLLRNFKLNNDICFTIAEFMPMKFKRESFLDFFKRKYNADTREFFGKRVFDVEQVGEFIKVIIY